MDGIYRAAARWDDDQALAALLAPLPAAIVANIQQGRASQPAGMIFSGMRHDEATASAFFVRTDSTGLLEVWTLRPCSLREAAEIWAHLKQQHADEMPDLGPPIKQAYTAVTGRRMEHIQ